MVNADLNVFDAVILGIMALSCLFAFFRGLVREILSLAAWIGAGIVTIYYFQQVSEKLQPYFKSPTVAAGAATIGIYLVALLGFAIINMLIIKSIKSSDETGVLDNLLGLVFGAFRGAFIIALGFFMITVAIPEKDYPEWLTKSVTRPYAEKGAQMLAKAAPEYLRSLSNLQKRALERAQQQRGGEPAEIVTPEDNIGYSPSSGNQLNRIIDGTGTQ
jgi:membrane protein required for colicin V production